MTTATFRIVGAIVGVCALAFAGAAAAGDFVAGFEDLPLMDGLAVVDGAGIAFDTPGGRIIERYAAGDVPEASVAGFYADTLPKLGWVSRDTLSFVREGESLDIRIGTQGELTTVHFALAPI